MKQCQICLKGSKMGGKRTKLRGNYNPTNKERKYPNIQKTLSFEGKRISACVKCAKTIKRDLALA